MSKKNSLISCKHGLWMLLLFAYLSNMEGRAQDVRLGIHGSVGMCFPIIKNQNTSDSLFALYGTPNGRPNGTYSIGFTSEFKLHTMFRIEGQLQYRFIGWRYKTRNNALKGSLRYSHLEVPVHLLFTFPGSSYSDHKYIGFGPCFSYIIEGKELRKISGLPLSKENIPYRVNKSNRNTLGFNAFVGYEDSENNSLRVGINLTQNYLLPFKLRGATLSSVFVQFIKYF